MTLLITMNKKHTCNVSIIKFISKGIISKVLINIVKVSIEQRILDTNAGKQLS